MHYFSSILFLILLSLSACNEKKEVYIEERGKIFHTTYSIKYKYTHSLQSEIEKQLAEFDNSLNPFKSTSIISKVNNNENVVLDTLFLNVFKKAMEVSSVTDGLFDITVSPLINAWGFGFKNMDNIRPSDIDNLRGLVGYEKIRLIDNRIQKDNLEIQINTSAIAKGYSVDVIAMLLESYGIKNYMIEIGGEIRASGVNSKNKCWQIGVTQPVDKDIFDYEHLQTIIELCNKSTATSGNYRKYYVKDGKKYAHTINPKTGYPSESKVLSATVIADDCMTADAYATAFMLMDTMEIRKIALQENLSYFLVLGIDDNKYVTVKSDNFIFFEKNDYNGLFNPKKKSEKGLSMR